MKRMFAGILTVGWVLLVAGATTFTSEAHHGRNYVDAGNNGVCDYSSASCQFVDDDCDGLCDNCGIYHSCDIDNCGNYTDADGDGICDNYASNRRHSGRHGHSSGGRGQGCRSGHC